jgi:octaprenyl-diphosphate synthase
MAPGTSASATTTTARTPKVLGRLGAVCAERGLRNVGERLLELQQWIAGDLAAFEALFGELPRESSAAHKCAHHLLDLGGKHLRPICVALAAKLGGGFGPAARELAVAIELIHNASLLHDDVIDVGQQRRGAPTARTIYGNSASVIGGNWLLVSALLRLSRAGVPGVLGEALETLDEMVAAEALQLDRRGSVRPSRADYFRVVNGKTASLFRLAMFCGARAGDLPDEQCRALARYGGNVGIAFQLVDDLLDYTGDPAAMGKTPFADLREGKMTYPLLLTLERDPSLRQLVERTLGRPADAPLPRQTVSRVLAAVVSAGCVRDCLALARRKARAAVACLDSLPPGTGRTALATLAEAIVHRDA